MAVEVAVILFHTTDKPQAILMDGFRDGADRYMFDRETTGSSSAHELRTPWTAPRASTSSLLRYPTTSPCRSTR